MYETVPGSFVPSSALHTMEAPLIPSSPGPSPGPTSYESLVPSSPGQSYYSSLPPEGAFASFQGSHQGINLGSQGYHNSGRPSQAYPGGGSLGFLAAGGGSDLAVGKDPLMATSRCKTNLSAAVWSSKHQLENIPILGGKQVPDMERCLKEGASMRGKRRSLTRKEIKTMYV